jgi:sugar phosphate isomerase/epimerase
MSMMQIARRDFLQRLTVGLAALPGALRAAGERLPIGFSTLGCPSWNWLKILDFAHQNGFAAVELRGLQGTMDLPSRLEFGDALIEQSKKEIASRGLRIPCVSSSANMHDTGQQHEQQLADARRFIDLAARLGASYVRVFGNKLIGPRAEAVEHIAASLRELGDYAAPKNVTVLLESHGDFTNSAILRELLEKAASPHVALLWDAHNTFVEGKEDPSITVRELGKYIRHTHLKDARLEGGQDRYVLTGRGDVPVKRQVELLAATEYAGYYSFEWEKAWHPEIEEPEVAIADFARVVAQYLPATAKHA